MPATPKHLADGLTAWGGKLTARRQSLQASIKHPSTWPVSLEAFDCPKAQARLRRNRLQRQVGLATLLVLVALLVYYVGSVPLEVYLVTTVFFGYIVYSEEYRVKPYREQVHSLSVRNRKLIEGRRQAGLLRLEQEVKQRRQGWSYPPKSGAAAIIRGNKDPQGRLNERSVVDYRSLCLTLVNKFELIALGREELGGDEDMARWLLQQLLQVGPLPGKDSELYRLLHTCLDEVDSDNEDTSFHCRLCLAVQTRSQLASRIRLECEHSLCEACAKQLAEDALAGHIDIPIACPVGCYSGANAKTGTLNPRCMNHLLEEAEYERLLRLYQVRMKLGLSAPHSKNLAADLAHARANIRDPRKSAHILN
mmetsp:Transcript_38706/g.84193  ORF Transcript_38706/g.84193 Transcript_38706/m.84193 type:complete len:365 (-) Transcript_38706:325-1419(-)|eukprot:CAMPEP_0118927228 /NCGR_PEP_ID=MMETSP1169-20130426/4741_1 /TAXON_ID=36882 /ORGANISM="Pyramimonas obovata, Strain CCMP722" /LENGTH=364 /DNA_ID=CAMNT_0006868951 /DNA_START=742 /DNA_END=1836 /DNA_ORIENTATION=-